MRWLAYEVPRLRAGERALASVVLENAGLTAWDSGADGLGINLAHHWRDRLGNPIVWDGPRSHLPRRIAGGEQLELAVELRAPMPPGQYRLTFDLVHEHRFWFAELGGSELELDVEVHPRLEQRALSVTVFDGPSAATAATQEALAHQLEPLAETGGARAYLVAGCRPDPDWSRRVLDAHQEGFVAVAGAVVVDGPLLARRKVERALAPWRPGFGRMSDWNRPLLCPSTLVEVPLGRYLGLPSIEPAAVDGPALCDGRIRVRVPATSARGIGEGARRRA